MGYREEKLLEFCATPACDLTASQRSQALSYKRRQVDDPQVWANAKDQMAGDRALSINDAVTWAMGGNIDDTDADEPACESATESANPPANPPADTDGRQLFKPEPDTDYDTSSDMTEETSDKLTEETTEPKETIMQDPTLIDYENMQNHLEQAYEHLAEVERTSALRGQSYTAGLAHRAIGKTLDAMSTVNGSLRVARMNEGRA